MDEQSVKSGLRGGWAGSWADKSYKSSAEDENNDRGRNASGGWKSESLVGGARLVFRGDEDIVDEFVASSVEDDEDFPRAASV